jgi:hypothetical protein
LLQAEIDDFVPLLAAETQLAAKPFHLRFKLLDLLLMRAETSLELLLQCRAQFLPDFVAIRLVQCLLPLAKQFEDSIVPPERMPKFPAPSHPAMNC